MSSIADNIKVIEDVSREAGNLFGGLSFEQLNWKPAAHKWSIAQCLQHLIIANETYYPQLDEVIAGRHKNSFYQGMGFISSAMGKRMVKDLGPVITRNFKNPDLFSPSTSNIEPAIVDEFEKHQQELLGRLKKLLVVNVHNTVIYSPVTKLIIYSVSDAVSIIAVHEQRHLLQAKRVLTAQSSAPGY